MILLNIHTLITINRVVIRYFRFNLLNSYIVNFTIADFIRRIQFWNNLITLIILVQSTRILDNSLRFKLMTWDWEVSNGNNLELLLSQLKVWSWYIYKVTFNRRNLISDYFVGLEKGNGWKTTSLLL